MPIGDRAFLLVCFSQPFPFFLSQTTQLPPHFEYLDPIEVQILEGCYEHEPKGETVPHHLAFKHKF
jgi:hypothetical protein